MKEELFNLQEIWGELNVLSKSHDETQEALLLMITRLGLRLGLTLDRLSMHYNATRQPGQPEFDDLAFPMSGCPDIPTHDREMHRKFGEAFVKPLDFTEVIKTEIIKMD